MSVTTESVKSAFCMQIPGVCQLQGKFSYIFCNKLPFWWPFWRPFCLHSYFIFIFLLRAKCLQLDSNFIAINLREKMGLRHFFHIKQFFSLIICLHLGRHLEYIKMLNDARVASLGFFKDNICTTRINKEKKFKTKFQVLLKFAQILLLLLLPVIVLPSVNRVLSNCVTMYMCRPR